MRARPPAGPTPCCETSPRCARERKPRGVATVRSTARRAQSAVERATDCTPGDSHVRARTDPRRGPHRARAPARRRSRALDRLLPRRARPRRRRPRPVARPRPVPPSSPPATTTITLHSTPGRARVARRRRQAIPASTTSRSCCPTSTRSRTWSAACWRRATRSTAHSTTAAPSRSTCATPTATASSSRTTATRSEWFDDDGEMILKADPFDPQELLYAQPA